MSADAHTDGLGVLGKLPFAEDAVVAIPSREQIAGILQAHGSKAPGVLRELERKRRELIALRKEDAWGYGYVPAVWKQAEALLWASALLVIFGANRSSKTWFAVWAAMRHMVQNPDARVLFLHNDGPQSIDVHQAIFWHYLPAAWKPKGGKRTRTATSKISYQPGDGFASDVVILPNGSQARFGNYQQDWKRFEGAAYTFINASERFPLPLMETLGFRLPGEGQTITVLWDFSPIDGITPAMDRVLKGARCVEHEPAVHLPPGHEAWKDQDWPAGTMPRLQEGATEGTRILYFWSEDNPLGAGRELRAKMKREKWDIITIERRMYGYARNVVGRALPRFGKVNIARLSDLEARGFLKQATRRMLYDPAGARNPFMTWFAADEHGRHTLYREWPDRQRFGEWAVKSGDETKWNGDKGPGQEKIGLGVVEQKRLILEAEGWVWNGKAFEEGPAGVEAIAERLIDPRAGAAQRQAENEEDGETLIDIFAEEQKDQDGNVVGPAMWFTPAPGLHEEHGVDVINTKYLAYDTKAEVVPLVNEPRFYVAAECEQSIYSLMNYRPSRGKRDEACKDPFDNVRYYFTSDPYWEEPGGPRYHKGRGGYG
jgi:hypothetical protein